MKKPVWIIIVLLLAITGFDAARPYFDHDAAHAATSLAERAEFWSFVALLAILGGALLVRRYRSRK